MKNLQKIIMLSLVCLSNISAQESHSEAPKKNLKYEELIDNICQNCKQTLIKLALVDELNYKNVTKATEIDQSDKAFAICIQAYEQKVDRLYEETADYVMSSNIQLDPSKKELLAAAFYGRANHERSKNGTLNVQDAKTRHTMASIESAHAYVTELLESTIFKAEETSKFIKAVVPSTKVSLLDSLKDAAMRAELDQNALLIQARDNAQIVPSKQHLVKVFNGILAHQGK